MANLIIISGPQAVGKMTVAEHLKNKKGYSLMVNHDSIEPAIKIFEKSSEAQKEFKLLFRKCAFETAIKHNVDMIFTLVVAYDLPEEVEKNEVRVEEYMLEDADYVIAAYGTMARVAKTAIATLREEGIRVGLIRPITLWPFPTASFEKAAETAKAFLSVEMSMGQMIEDVRLATGCKKPVGLCNRTGGMIPSPDQVLESIRKAQKGEF